MDKQKINELCSGNTEAVNLLSGLWKLFCVWDDCVDRDKPVNETDINKAFMWAMFDLNENDFYKAHEAQLKTAIFSCVSSWIVANNFEKIGATPLLERAYVMRCSPYVLFGAIVLLASGFDKQIQAIEYFHSVINGDTLQSYLIEHGENHYVG